MKLNRRSLKSLRALGAIDVNSLANSYGIEWLALRPEVLQKVLQHGFPGDVYGGQAGIKAKLPGGTFFAMFACDESTGCHVLRLPNGSARVYQGMDSSGLPLEYNYDPNVLYFTARSEDANVLADVGYSPGYAASYAAINGWLQVEKNQYNGSWLSLGAAGGYRDPRLIEWSDAYGLITPEYNHLYDRDSWWEANGPMLIVSMGFGAIIGMASAAGIGAETTATAASAAETGAAVSAAETGAATAAETGFVSTEAMVAYEEAMREYALADALGATITQGEAAAWATAISNAGYAVPAGISDAAAGTGASYSAPEALPEAGYPPPGATSPISAGDIGAPWYETAAKIINSPLTKAGVTLATTAYGIASRPNSQNRPVNPAPYAQTAPGDYTSAYDYASPGMNLEYGSFPNETAGARSSFNWAWLIAAGAGLYYMKRKSAR